MIKFRNVFKSYGSGPQILSDINLEIPRGQVCVILGPSGSGKSTLLRHIIGLVLPTRGSVLINDVEVTKKTIGSLRKRIGMVHQSFGLVPRSSVAQNVLNGSLAELNSFAAVLGLFPKKYKTRAAECIAATGLDETFLNRRVSELSGGQQQRIGIARAFMMNPEIIIADEPVASLDPKISEDIMALLITQAAKQNSSVICSLHQVDLACKYADRIVAIGSGKIIFDGTPDTLGSENLKEIFGLDKRQGSQA
jgi:phosphonate transport system ATP-binding protein